MYGDAGVLIDIAAKRIRRVAFVNYKGSIIMRILGIASEGELEVVLASREDLAHLEGCLIARVVLDENRVVRPFIPQDIFPAH